MDLDELSRSAAALDDATFVRRFPHPALVFVTASTPPEDEAKVDTPTGGTKLPAEGTFSRTSAFKATDSFPAVADMMKAVQANADTPSRELIGGSPVVFLQKSGRNPFESMITVGRATNNDHCIPLPTISKVHAYFTKSPLGEWRLTDQRATNGTWVNGQKLEPGGGAPLADGTRISFGPDARAKFFTPQGLFGFLALYRSGLAV